MSLGTLASKIWTRFELDIENGAVWCRLHSRSTAS
jgi:hypothetical protein